LAVNNIIEGTVREAFDRLRITVRVLGADGFQVSSRRFETIADAESLIRVQEQIATASISRARPEQSRIRQRNAMPGV
jgi:TolB-like protein